MAIDGIGRKGPPAPPAPGGPSGPPKADKTGRAFEVSRSAPPPAAGSVEVRPAALDRLRKGEIDVDGYVDAKVTEATAHLGPLPAARLAEIRAALRDRVLSDPTLADLVRTAAGSVPSPTGDD
jgi:hypothetical protein